jgi:hypothetical protein
MSSTKYSASRLRVAPGFSLMKCRQCKNLQWFKTEDLSPRCDECRWGFRSTAPMGFDRLAEDADKLRDAHARASNH